jgi:hypothetical protein
MRDQKTLKDNHYINPILDFILSLICIFYVIKSIINIIKEFIYNIQHNKKILVLDNVLTIISYKYLCKRFKICL